MGLGRDEEAWRVAWDSEAANLEVGGATSVPAVLAILYECNLAEAERVTAPWLARHPELRPTLAARWVIAWRSGDVATAVTALDELTARYSNTEPYFSASDAALTLIQAGRVSEGRKLLQDRLQAAQAKLKMSNLPRNDRIGVMGSVAGLQASLGQRDQAIEALERYEASWPPTGDDWARGQRLYVSAIVLTQVGEIDRAIDRLHKMFSLPLPPWGASGVWCEPKLRPLRADPRFRDLIAQHGGNVAIDPHDRSTWPPPRTSPPR
jgi:tetratricopeptide (TPR) repeat protein